MNPMELSLHRANTVAFIAADPIVLELNHFTLQRTGSGGQKMAADGKAGPESYRLIPANDRTPVVKSLAGQSFTPEYTLFGAHDCSMRIWDTFQFDGVWYQIAGPIRPLHTENAYYKKGDVIRRDASA